MILRPPTAPGNPGGPAPGTHPPGKLTGLRCPLCEGQIFQTAPDQLTCPACADEPPPTPVAIAEQIRLGQPAGGSSLPPAPAATVAAEAVRQLHARRAALSACEANSMVHNGIAAARELHARLTATADALDGAAEQALEAAGLDVPAGEWVPFGLDSFAHAKEEFAASPRGSVHRWGWSAGNSPRPPTIPRPGGGRPTNPPRT